MESIARILLWAVAAGDPSVSAEVAIDAPVLVPSSNQHTPAADFDGSKNLVVWSDDAGRILAARVARTATASDTSPAIVVAGSGQSSNPAVACAPGLCLVAYQTYAADTGSDIEARRIDGRGRVLDPIAIPVARQPGPQDSPSVAARPDGTGFMVVWRDKSGADADIHGARVDALGAGADTPPLVISSAAGDQEAPSVTGDGNPWLVVWSDGRAGAPHIYDARVTAAGAVEDPMGISIAGTSTMGQRRPVAAYDPGTPGLYFVAWSDERALPAFGQIRAIRVARDGTSADGDGLLLGTSPGQGALPSPKAAGIGGGDLLVVWDAKPSPNRVIGNLLHLARLQSFFGFSTPGPSSQTSPAASASPQGALLLWEDDRLAHRSIIFGATISATTPLGQASAAAPYDLRANRESQPAVAFDPGAKEYMVVWRDDRSGATNLFGARFDGGGHPVGAGASAISESSRVQFFPAAACASGGCLVLWDSVIGSQNQIFARRFSGGQPADTSSIAVDLAAPGEGARIVFDGQSYLLAKADEGSNGLIPVSVRRIGTDGMEKSLRTIPAVGGVGAESKHVRISAGTSNALALWSVALSGDDGVYAALLSPALDLALGPVRLPTVPGADYPEVVWTGAKYVALMSAADANGRFVLSAVTLDGAGAVDSPPFAISTGDLADRVPGLASDAHGAIAVFAKKDGNVYGRTIAQSGRSVGPDEFTISTSSVASSGAAIGSGAPGYLVAYERGGRIYQRVLSFACAAAPDGTVCDDGDPCTAGDRCQDHACVGTPMSSTPDCAPYDAGVLADGAVSDGAALIRDAGTATIADAGTGPKVKSKSGCGCSSAGGGGRGASALLFFALAASWIGRPGGWSGRRGRDRDRRRPPRA